jgi:hypothetical protein
MSEDVELAWLQVLRDSNSGVSVGIIGCINRETFTIQIDHYSKYLKSATDLISERDRDARLDIRNNYNLIYRSQIA